MATNSNFNSGGPASAGRQLRLGLAEGIRDGWAIGTNDTLADLVATRSRGLAMYYVLLYVAMFAKFTDLVGRPPASDRELGRVLKASHVTLSRYRARFEEAFPELDTPAPLLASLPDVEIGSDVEAAAYRLGGARL